MQEIKINKMKKCNNNNKKMVNVKFKILIQISSL